MTSLTARQSLSTRILCRVASKYERKSRPLRPSSELLCYQATTNLSPARAFTTTPSLCKKGGKGKNGKNPDEEDGDDYDDIDGLAREDPFDFYDLQENIDEVLRKLEKGLSRFRTGGRFNPEILENMRVELDKKGKQKERLGDLAQVVPKGGRIVTILVGEQEHVRPITSAIQRNPALNMTPQVDAHDPLLVNVPIPPPTKESREQELKAANKVGADASLGVRNARAVVQKKFRTMAMQRVERKLLYKPDDLKKAHKEMEKLVAKGIAEVKTMLEACKKEME